MFCLLPFMIHKNFNLGCQLGFFICMHAGIKGDAVDGSKGAPHPAPTAADSSATSSDSSSPAESTSIKKDQRQQQQSSGLKGVEDRLSFLELELLKLTLQPASAQQQLLQDAEAGTASSSSSPSSSSAAAAAARGLDPAAAAAAGYGTPEPWGWPGYAAAANMNRPDSQPGLGLISQPELLDPEVLAIAEALLIRKGLPYSAAAFGAPPGAAGWQQGQYPQQQQQQGRVRTPSSIWGRRRAAQQLRAKPWRYADGPSAAAAAASTQGLMPYGYQPNGDASLIRNRGAGSSSSSVSGRPMPGGVPGPDGFYGNYPAGYYGPGFDPRYGPGFSAGYEQASYDGLMGADGNDDDLAPYEPSGWAVAGTVLVVYAGVLLTFFALLAGAGDVGAAVYPADVMLINNNNHSL
jgi:hypothetical protein